MTAATWFCLMTASAATAVSFNVPRAALWMVPVVAAAGYTLAALGMQAGMSEPEALFVAAFAVAMAAESLAGTMRLPALVTAVPGIIPLVPGSTAYAAMAAAVAGEYGLAAENTVVALLSAGGIASGLLLAAALVRAPGGPVAAGKIVPRSESDHPAFKS
ncbi:MAG: threonine/serine exporter family protein [Armatimonadetes bacterium]|nr:threonine/serine exporter family protein [Armatimonadota bacterium]